MTEPRVADILSENELPFTAKDWSQTPERVQLFVLSLLHRVDTLETTVAELQNK